MEDIFCTEALADKVHAEASAPDKAAEGLSVEGSRSTRSGSLAETASAQAVEAQRRRERLMAQAHDEEQRRMIQKDTAKQFHRISLLFYGTRLSW